MDNGLSQSHLAVSILLLLELVRYQYSVQRRRRIETRISYGSLCPTEAKLISSSSKVVCHSSALRTVHLCGCLTAVQLVFRASSIRLKMAAYTHVQTKKKRKCKSSVHQTKKKRKCKSSVHHPGVEPGSRAWKAHILTVGLMVRVTASSRWD